jgi:GTP cyclohydrolase I
VNIHNKDVDILSDSLEGIDIASKDDSSNLENKYDSAFEATDEYIESLPDLQNGPATSIKGVNKQIQHVGVSNFKLPIRYKSRDGSELLIETSVTGSVSLDANKKGINMSRIMRSFYKHADSQFNFNVIQAALDDYKSDLDSLDARILMKFSFPIKKKSLRSNLEGFQYYNIALELVDNDRVRSKIIHVDYVYSSTCPCSLELSEHARTERSQLATPHSQRSIARISALINPKKLIWIEDIIELCREAVPTETQVMVKREDEQAFAELNAANPIFVEDAARLFCKQLENNSSITDFRIVVCHQESLHSHDAVSVLTSGPTFVQTGLEPNLFQSLYHLS